jgi:hypothetical protein
MKPVISTVSIRAGRRVRLVVTLASTPGRLYTRALGEDTMIATTTADSHASQEDIVIEVLKDFSRRSGIRLAH